ETMLRGVLPFFEKYYRDAELNAVHAWMAETEENRTAAKQSLVAELPARPPTFCIGCPERPVFAALKLVSRELGPVHVAGDIGCHSFATFEPFSLGNSIMGYGMSLASAAGVSPLMSKRPIAVMGDGGFWHNGLLSGVASSLLNRDDGVLVIMKNGYTSATGTQDILSTPIEEATPIDLAAAERSQTHSDETIENTLRGMGVKWLRTV